MTAQLDLFAGVLGEDVGALGWQAGEAGLGDVLAIGVGATIHYRFRSASGTYFALDCPTRQRNVASRKP